MEPFPPGFNLVRTYKKPEDAEVDGYCKKRPDQYGGEECIVEGVLYVRRASCAVSHSVWRRNGFFVPENSIPHAVLTAPRAGKRIQWPVFRQNQVLPIPKFSAQRHEAAWCATPTESRSLRLSDKERTRIDEVCRKYGITAQDFDVMMKEQEMACFICKRPFSDEIRPHVDHNHETQEVRGLLCVRCNCGLGQFRDDDGLTDEATRYLRYRSGKATGIPRPSHVPAICSVCNDGRPDPKPARVCFKHSDVNVQAYAAMVDRERILKRQLSDHKTALDAALKHCVCAGSGCEICSKTRAIATGTTGVNP